LTQDYLECRNDPFTVITNQAGAAVGNLSLLSPFIVIFILLVLDFFRNFCRWNIPNGFKRSEKDDVLDDIAVNLLLITKNKKFFALANTEDLQLLLKLAEELEKNKKKTFTNLQYVADEIIDNIDDKNNDSNDSENDGFESNNNLNNLKIKKNETFDLEVEEGSAGIDSHYKQKNKTYEFQNCININNNIDNKNAKKNRIEYDLINNKKTSGDDFVVNKNSEIDINDHEIELKITNENFYKSTLKSAVVKNNKYFIVNDDA
jgi:hypothetical protein